jgi:hypothetical protein
VSEGQAAWIPTERTPRAFWAIGIVCFGSLATFVAGVNYFPSLRELGLATASVVALAEGRFIFGFAMAASAWAFRPRSILIEPEGLTVKRWLGGIRRFAWENVRVFPGRRPEFGRFTYQGRGPGYFLLSLNQFNAL